MKTQNQYIEIQVKVSQDHQELILQQNEKMDNQNERISALESLLEELIHSHSIAISNSGKESITTFPSIKN